MNKRLSGMKPDIAKLKEYYTERGYSIREIALLLNLNPATILYHMKRNNIETREKRKRSKLMKYTRDTIEQGIKDKGVRGYAKELKIHANTLRNYRKTLIK